MNGRRQPRQQPEEILRHLQDHNRVLWHFFRGRRRGLLLAAKDKRGCKKGGGTPLPKEARGHHFPNCRWVPISQQSTKRRETQSKDQRLSSEWEGPELGKGTVEGGLSLLCPQGGDHGHNRMAGLLSSVPICRALALDQESGRWAEEAPPPSLPLPMVPLS